MSQVKNLRAMFENKGEESSPPDRGRSPALSSVSASNSHCSPRPLSKVRTSFVAIEKDGKMGLRRDPSHESSTSRRLSSTDADSDTASIALQSDFSKVPRRLFADDPIPESPGIPSTAATDKPEPRQSEPVQDEPVAALNPTNANSPPKPSTAESKLKAERGKEDESPQVSQSTSLPSKRPTSTQPPVAESGGAQTPSKTASSAVKATPKRGDTKPVGKPQSATRTPRLAPSASTPSLRLSASQTGKDHVEGFTKPKPKSPTRPVKLPASLLAPTASSVSKGAESRQTHSRQSGNIQSGNAGSRAPSRANVSTTNAPNKTLKRQPSTLNRPRPSLGPPPRKAAQESAPKKEVHVDESFLARMMRPTQSSASKVSEKAPVTPPRRPATRPSTSNAERSPMESHSARKAASRARNRTVTSRAHNRRSNSQDTPPKEATRKTSADSVDHAEKSVAQPAQEVNDVSVPGRGEAEMEHQSTDAIQAPIDSQPVNSEAEELLAQPSGQEHSLHGPSAYSTMESAVQEPTIPEEAVSTAEETAINDERSESSKAVTPETPLGLEKQVIKIPAPVDETEVEDLAVKLSAVRISPPPEAETDW